MITNPEPTDVPATSEADELASATLRDRALLALLLVGTAVAYIWNISINGMSNGFYAGAAWAGSRDWKALLFGSLDAQNFITVDKPPVSQWIMGLSGQLFGFSSASMLIPEAVMGVLSVWLIYGAVARVSGRNAGLVAGLALAVMPVSALMFRFNNPDAVMVLLMTAAAYCTVRALPRANLWWVALAGVALGFAFLAKMLEGLMVMPALGIAYLFAAPTSIRNRIVHIFVAAATTFVSSAWYVVLTIVWPASSRPYLAGSVDNSFMDLVIGYNGMSRILGGNRNSGANNAQMQQLAQEQSQSRGGGFGSAPGLLRLFNGEMGYEISWLLPAALVALVVLAVATWKAPRTDLLRAAALLFGLWLLIDGAVLSAMRRLPHAYYAFAIAPAIAALVGLGAREVWIRRDSLLGQIGGAAMILTAGGWSYELLHRNHSWLPPLRYAIAALMLVGVLAIAVRTLPNQRSWVRQAALALALVGFAAGFAGPTAYSVVTIANPHTGGSPTVGPPRKDNNRGGGFGNDGATNNPELVTLLTGTHTRWSAAIDRSSSAASLELASNTSVMAIGGFGNSDPVPTLADFQGYVQRGEVSFYLVADRSPRNQQAGSGQNGGQSGNRNQPSGGQQPNRGGMNNRPSPHQDIADWVKQGFESRKIGAMTVYDLTQPKVS